MLAIHWSPVKNTKRILSSGITKSKKGLYCFPLTGNHQIDQWWVRLFNSVRNRKKYNGFVFRISQNDLPAYFGYWFGATSWDAFDKPMLTLKALKDEVRRNLLFRAGEYIMLKKGKLNKASDFRRDFVKIAMGEMARNDEEKKLLHDFEVKKFTLEDIQIVLSSSISPRRILKVISDGTETGRQRRRRKKKLEFMEKNDQ